MKAALFVLGFALTIYALLDCARTPEDELPARMPKFMWIMIIVLVTLIGPIAWIIVSRVAAAERRGGYVEPTVWSSPEPTPLKFPERPRPVAPDDDPEFLRSLDEQIHHHGEASEAGTDSGKPGDEGEEPGSKPGSAPDGEPGK